MKYLVSIIILFFNFTFINCQNWYWLIKTNKKVYQFLTDNCSNSADWNYCTYQGCPSSDSVINYLSSSNPSRGEYKFSYWNFPTLIDFDNSTNLNDDCYQKLAVVSTPAATYQNNNSIIFLKKDNNIQWYYYGFNNDYNYTLNESIKLTNIEFTNTDSLLSETLVLELYASTVFIDSIEIQKNNINTYNEYTFSLNNFFRNQSNVNTNIIYTLKIFYKIKGNATDVNVDLISEEKEFVFYINNYLTVNTTINNNLCTSGGSLIIYSVINDLGTAFNSCAVTISKDGMIKNQENVNIPHTFTFTDNGNYTLTIYKDNHVQYNRNFSINGNNSPFQIVSSNTNPSCSFPQHTGDARIYFNGYHNSPYDAEIYGTISSNNNNSGNFIIDSIEVLNNINRIEYMISGSKSWVKPNLTVIYPDKKSAVLQFYGSSRTFNNPKVGWWYFRIDQYVNQITERTIKFWYIPDTIHDYIDRYVKISNLYPANYNITISGEICTTNGSFDILAIQTPVLSISDTIQPVCNESKGTITAEIQRQTILPYYFYLNTNLIGNSSSTNFIFNNLDSGSYSVYCKDAQGCESNKISVLLNYQPPIIHSLAHINPTCWNGSNGSITVNTSNADSILLYDNAGNLLMIKPADNKTFTNLAASVYRVKAKKKACLTADSTVVLTNPPIPQFDAIFKSQPVTCAGDSDGKIIITDKKQLQKIFLYPTGGNAIDSISETGNTFYNLSAGTYMLQGRTPNGCLTDSDTIIVAGKDPITALAIATSLRCPYDSASGTIQIREIKGGNGGYKYSIAIDSLFDTFNSCSDTVRVLNLLEGKYYIKIKDSQQCESQVNSVIITRPKPLTFNADTGIYNGYPIPCHDDMTKASVQFLPGGGTGPLTVLIDSLSSQTARFDNLSLFQHYTFHIKDGNNCIADTSIRLTRQPEPLSIHWDTSNYHGYAIRCFNGSDGRLKIIPNGGVAPYTIAVTYKGTTIANVIDTMSITLMDRPAGTYIVTITDKNKCSYTDSITLSQPPALSGKIFYFNMFEGAYSDTFPYHGYAIACHGTNTTVKIQGMGGVEPYTYNWHNAEDSTNYITNSYYSTAAGQYVIKIKDANNCVAQIDYTINEPDTFVIESVVPDIVNCYYYNDGSITVAVKGGVSNMADCKYILYNQMGGPIDTIISNKQHAIFSNLYGSIYNIKVWDDNQCWANKDAIDIRNLDTLRVSVAQAIMPSCYGGNDGSIKLSSRIINNSNYLYPYTYTVSKINAQNRESIINKSRNRDTLWVDNLYVGLYRIQVTDSIGCVDSIDYTLSQPAKMEILIDTIIPNRCFNDSTATLRVRAIGGVGGYKFAYAYDTYGVDFSENQGDTSSILELNRLNWNKNNTDSPLTYIVKLKDRNYKATQAVCLITDSFTLPSVQRIRYDIITASPSCFNYNDGKIYVNNLRGGTGYTDSWKIYWQNDLGDTISTNQIVTNLPAGTYSISIVDSLGCLATNKDLELENPPRFNAIRQSIDISCDALGTVSYQLENINGPIYEVKHNTSVFSRNADEDPIFVVDTGRHVFTFSNSQGCVANDSFEVYYPSPVIDSVQVMDASIGGANNGSAYVFAHCGNGNNQYIWTLPDGSVNTTSTPFISYLSTGKYRVRAIDSKGLLSSPYDFMVNETDRISIGIDSLKPATCPQACNGYISIRINAPSPIEAIDWKDSSGNVIAHDYALKGIKAGTYYVEVKDSLSNIGQLTTIVNSGRNVTISSIETSPVSCNGGHDGTIIVKAEGGSGKYLYQWNNGETSANILNLSKGTYSVRITDAGDSACYTVGSAHISAPDSINIRLIYSKKPTCKGGNDGELGVNADGGNGSFNYYWPSKQVYGSSLKGISPGNYEVEVTDRKGCKSVATFTLPDTIPIEIASLALNMPLCNGSRDGSISISLKNGRSPYMIYWPDLGKNVTGSVRTNLQAGSYRIEARDANGCIFKDTFELGQPVKLEIDSVQHYQPLCSYSTNGSLRIYSSGGTPPYVYRVNNQSSTSSLIANLNQGSYTVYVFDKNNCSASQEVRMSAPSPVDYAYTIKIPSCKGYNDGSIIVEPFGGTAPYKIFMHNVRKPKEMTNLSAGNYEIVVQDTNNCAVSKTVSVTQPEQLTATITTAKENPCFGDCKAEMIVTANGGSGKYLYTWNDQTTDSVKMNACAGNHTVDVKDKNNCTYRLSHRINQPAAIVNDSVVIIDPTCFNGKDGKILVKYKGGTGSLNYFWKHGQKGNEANGLSAGTYYVTVKDVNNCSRNDSFVVNNTPKENIKNITSYYKLCEGQVMPLWPGLWRSYLWYKDGKFLQSDDTLWVNTPGKYAIKVVSLKGCDDSLNFEVEYTTMLIKANFLLSHQAVADEEVQIIDVSWPIPEHINWEYNTDSIELINNSDDRQTIRFKYPGEYLLKLKTAAYQCVDSVVKQIVVYGNYDDLDKGKLPIEENSDILELRLYPNPNNGTFNIYIKLIDKQDITLEISNISTGYRIYKNELKGSDNYDENINVTGQPSGVYTLKVITSKQIKYVHFIII